MAHTDARSPGVTQQSPLWSAGLLICLGLLPFPYFMFAGLFGFLGLTLWQTATAPRSLARLLYQQGFIILSGLLVLSASLAVEPGEALVQLAHFLPFFWAWAALVQYLDQIQKPWREIGRWAGILVLTTVPLNIVGIVEFTLKRSLPAEALVQFPLIDWLYIGDFDHPRAFSLFDYPNTLANYLVMMLGLNIGLLFLRHGIATSRPLSGWIKALLAVNILLTLLCIYCSGSRNGYLVAAVLLLIGFCAMRASRWVRSLGLMGLAIIVVTTLQFGIGGRSLSWAWVTDDPRVGVWHLALTMIRDRPLLGCGLGNYKLLYNGEVPGYDFIAHAHNLWLMLAAEAGIPVMIGMTLAIGAIAYRGVKGLWQLRPHPDRYAILLGYHLCFLGTLLFALFDVTLSEARVNWLGWLSLAVLYCGPELSQMPHRSQLDQLDGP